MRQNQDESVEEYFRRFEAAIDLVHLCDVEETIGYMRTSVFAEFNKRKTAAESYMAALWSIIFGQCTGSLQQHIKAEGEYDQHICDAVWLLQILKKVIAGAINQSNI